MGNKSGKVFGEVVPGKWKDFLLKSKSKKNKIAPDPSELGSRKRTTSITCTDSLIVAQQVTLLLVIYLLQNIPAHMPSVVNYFTISVNILKIDIFSLFFHRRKSMLILKMTRTI